MTDDDSGFSFSSEDDLQLLIDNAVAENEVLDFKRAFYSDEVNGQIAGQEFAKDCAAFANLRGGVLILGIREVGGVAKERRPFQRESPEGDHQRLLQWLGRFTSPIVTVEIYDVVSGSGGYYLVIRVPSSLNQPHAVAVPGSPQLIYPVRHGQDTRFMSENEVARRYDDRLRGQERRRTEFDNLVGNGWSALDRSTEALWLYLVIRPDDPVPRRLDSETANSIIAWRDSNVFEAPYGIHLATYQPIAGPGCMTFSSPPLQDDDDEGVPRDSYLELHADGSAFAAIDMRLRTATSGAVAYYSLVAGMMALIEDTVTWAVESAGGPGAIRVASGLRSRSKDDWVVRLVRGGSHENGPVLRSRTLMAVEGLLTTRDETVGDLTACRSQRSRFALTYTCLSQVLQRFGRPEPEQLTHDGGFRVREWKEYGEVRNWLDRHGIEAVEEMAPRYDA